MGDILQDLEAKVRKAAADARTESGKKWASSLQQSMVKGAGLIHRLTKPKLSWTSTSAVKDEHITLSDAVTQLMPKPKSSATYGAQYSRGSSSRAPISSTHNQGYSPQT